MFQSLKSIHPKSAAIHGSRTPGHRGSNTSPSQSWPRSGRKTESTPGTVKYGNTEWRGQKQILSSMIINEQGNYAIGAFRTGLEIFLQCCRVASAPWVWGCHPLPLRVLEHPRTWHTAGWHGSYCKGSSDLCPKKLVQPEDERQTSSDHKPLNKGNRKMPSKIIKQQNATAFRYIFCPFSSRLLP